MRMAGFSVLDLLVVAFVGLLTLSGCISPVGNEFGASLVEPGTLDCLQDARTEPRTDVVTTSLLVPVTPGVLYCQGWVSARFTATALSNGDWSVSADFRPHNLSICVPPPHCTELCGFWCNDVNRRASADFTATPGVQTQLTAPGMRWTNPVTGVQVDVVLLCTLTLDAAGTVTVQLITI